MKIYNLPIANDQRLNVFGGVNVIESEKIIVEWKETTGKDRVLMRKSK